MKENQREKIVNYIDTFGKITPLDAFADLGVMRLATRIFELKQLGYDIKTEMTKGRNRFGDTVYFATYSWGDKK